jgi:hypothetical protein
MFSTRGAGDGASGPLTPSRLLHHRSISLSASTTAILARTRLTQNSEILIDSLSFQASGTLGYDRVDVSASRLFLLLRIELSIKNTTDTLVRAIQELKETYSTKKTNDQKLYLELFATKQQGGTPTDSFHTITVKTNKLT